MSYDDLCYTRHHEIDGVSDWLWIKSDTGAWEGPSMEWSSHKERYLKYSKGFGSVLQAGGNCGLYPRLLSNIYGLVYTFEPDLLNFHCLVNNCQRDNIIKMNCALGLDRQNVVVNRHTMENVGMHQVSQVERNSIPQLRIDDLNLNLDAILLDVEGYEPYIIDGARYTIARSSPLVVCERGGDSILNLLTSINNQYKLVDVNYQDYYYTT